MTSGTSTAPAVPSGAAGAVRPGPAETPAVLRTVVGIDTDLVATLDVDHLIAGLAETLPAGSIVATHLVRDDRPHVAVSVDLPGALDRRTRNALVGVWTSRPLVVELLADDGTTIDGDDDVPPGARLAASETLTGSGGRAVLYPGSGELTGDLTVAELLSRSAIDRVVDLAGSEVDPAIVVWTRDFVRPLRAGRHIELTVQPARDATVVPFEDPSPTPCCATHAVSSF